MENILNSKWHHKINCLFYVKYKLIDDLADEERFDVIMHSHGRFYLLSHNHNDESFENKLTMLPEKKIGDTVFDCYFDKQYQFINYYMITPESLYFETNRQFYHKMHFDIVSEDGTKGLMFFVKEMLGITLDEMTDILDTDIAERQFGEIIEEYKENDMLWDVR